MGRIDTCVLVIIQKKTENRLVWTQARVVNTRVPKLQDYGEIEEMICQKDRSSDKLTVT